MLCIFLGGCILKFLFFISKILLTLLKQTFFIKKFKGVVSSTGGESSLNFLKMVFLIPLSGGELLLLERWSILRQETHFFKLSLQKIQISFMLLPTDR